MAENINAKNLKGIPLAILAKLMNEEFPIGAQKLLVLLQNSELTPRVADFRRGTTFDLKSALHFTKKAVQDTKSGLDPERT